MDILNIKCPFCGCVLKVKNQEGIETKYVTCLNCKNKSPFTNFKKIELHNDEETLLPESAKQKSSNAEETQLETDLNLAIGSVIIDEKPIMLKIGKNVIGRKSEKSAAAIQINTNGNCRMSREHLLIEVKKVAGKGMVHYASLYKEKTNATFIGNEKLEYGDTIVLKRGDIIRLPDKNIRFEIIESDSTIF